MQWCVVVFVCVCFFVVTLCVEMGAATSDEMMSHPDSVCTLSFSAFFFPFLFCYITYVLPTYNFLFSSSEPLSRRKIGWNLWCIYFDIYLLGLIICILLNNILMCTGKLRRRKVHTRSNKSGAFVGNIIPFTKKKKKLCPPACLHSRCISSFNILVISAGAKV